MKTSRLSRALVTVAAITCVFLVSQGAARAADRRDIAVGILNGIANGLNGVQSPFYPPQMNNFPPQPNNFPPQPNNFPPQPNNFPPQPNNFPPQPNNFPPPFTPQLQGPITSQDPFGNSITIHPSAMNPGANIPVGQVENFQKFVPGRGWVNGTRWLGADGEWHGDTTLVDPSGTQTTVSSYARSVKKYPRSHNRGYYGR